MDRLPLGILSYLSNVVGIIGNSLVLFVFLKRYNQPTNYKVFVVYMAVQDTGTCIAHIAKEMNRMFSGDRQAYRLEITCTLSHYLGNSVGQGSMIMALFITIERHRKICTPFKRQITIFQSKMMCLVTLVASAVMNIPMIFIIGRRDVVIDSRNATRCSVKNSYDRNPLSIYFFTFQAIQITLAIIGIIILMSKIQKRLLRQSRFKTKDANFKRSEKIRTVHIQSERSNEMGENSIEIQNQKSGRDGMKSNGENAKNRKIIRTFSIVISLLLACYLTFAALQTYLCFRRYFVHEMKITDEWDRVLEYLPDVVSFNGVLNPAVYFFTDTRFKTEVCGLFRH